MSRQEPSMVDAARRLLELTARAWKIRPESAHAVARRAPHGYVSKRLARRLGMAGDTAADFAQAARARA